MQHILHIRLTTTDRIMTHNEKVQPLTTLQHKRLFIF